MMQNPYHKYSQSQVENKVAKPKKRAVKKAPKSRKKKNRVRAKNNKPFSLLPILFSTFVLSLSFYVFNYPDETMNFLNSIEVSFSNASAAEEEKKSTQSDKKKENVAALPVGSISGRKPGAKDLTMKNASVFSALKEKEKSLQKKERRLVRLEEELQKQKVEIEKQLKELKQIQRNISSKLDQKVIADEKNVEKLVGVYANMKPKSAATIISQIDEKLAIKVLGRMKKQSAAAILNFVEPGKAQRLSEQYAGLKK